MLCLFMLRKCWIQDINLASMLVILLEMCVMFCLHAVLCRMLIGYVVLELVLPCVLVS